MSFRENLLKKIRINRIAKKVDYSMGPPDSGRRIDKKIARELLAMGPYEYRRERDLDLYVRTTEAGEQRVLVLDNEFAIYKTDPEDVGLRKSPTLREMVKIRNAIKILGDKDIVVSKKSESVETLRNQCIGMLDLSFSNSDIDEITGEGVASFERGFTDGVVECLDLFAELTGYVPPPKAFGMMNFKIIGKLGEKNGSAVYGPAVVYGIVKNEMKLIDRETESASKEKLNFFHRAVIGKEEADLEGPEVFEHLKKAVDPGRDLSI